MFSANTFGQHLTMKAWTSRMENSTFKADLDFGLNKTEDG